MKMLEKIFDMEDLFTEQQVFKTEGNKLSVGQMINKQGRKKLQASLIIS